MPTMDKRERILRGLRAYFSRERMPRLAMSFVLILTAGAGFFCSRLLMHAGLDVMAVRSLISTLAAWGILIMLMRLWIEIERRKFNSPADLARVAEHQGHEHENPSWEHAGDVAVRALDAASSSVDDPLGCLIGLLIAAAVFLFVGVLCGFFMLIASAPALLAEAFLDAVVAGFLTRGVRTHDAQWWAGGIIRRTWKVAIPLAVLLASTGFALQKWKPAIHTLGDLFR